jgi:hypothetical protein
MQPVAGMLPAKNTKPWRGVAANLNKAENDTGRTAFCGPYVLSAITGRPISAIEEAFRLGRGRPPGSDTLIKGTDANEVAAALASFGYRMELVSSFLDRPKKERPTVWSWMQKPRVASTFYILAINRGRQGHWILIKGVMLCDTYTQGDWAFVCDGPHRGARIMEIFGVTEEQ